MNNNSNLSEWLKKIDSVIANGKYKDSWASLAQYECPKWFRDAKFGIFIHWGVYSVPAFGSEWYSRNMYREDSAAYLHHIERYGSQSKFGYKDFIPLFTAPSFDADNWLSLIKKSGARYAVPVAEHHDGFAMYDTKLSKWSSVNMGPHRDVIGEVFSACDKFGIIKCASTHRLEHWFFMGPGRNFESDIRSSSSTDDLYWPSLTPDPSFVDPECDALPPNDFLDDWLVRTCEFIDLYRPSLLYFDWWIMHNSTKEHLKKIAAYYYNRAEEWKSEVVITYKYDAFPLGTAVPDMERGQFAFAKPFTWQSCTSVAKNSWGHTDKNEYKSAYSLICSLADVVSKNGNLLLNIDPKADGTIPPETESLLYKIGKWLEVNGAAIFGSSPWRVHAEGTAAREEAQFSDSNDVNYTSQDIRYTVNNGCVYAIVLGNSENNTYRLKSFAKAENIDVGSGFKGSVRSVRLLDGTAVTSWHRNNEFMEIVTEPRADFTMPIVFEISKV